MQWKFIVFFFLYFCSGKCAWYTKIDYRYRKRKRIKYIALWCLCKKKFSDLRCTFSDRIFEDYATVHLTFFNLMIWIGVVGSPSGSGCPFWFQIQLCSGGIEFRTIDWSSFSYIPAGWEWKKPAWKKPLVLTGKNRAEKPRHFKGKTGFWWIFQFLGRFY
jgi:hypothetical protein